MAASEPELDALIGATIAGRFTVVSLIAAGTMGRVYIATQKPLGRRVALKVMHILGDSHEVKDFAARFDREASVLCQLESPHTVRLFDSGKDGDLLYLAMEYIEGPTLQQVLQAGPVEPLRAIALVRQICEALDEAHLKGIVHRDLKPSNVLLGNVAGKEFVKVVDFGLVKVNRLNGESTQPGLVLGTPNYMAPEQIRGDEVDHRTDIYALGVIFFAMLSGEKPFDVSGSSQMIAAHLTQKPRDLFSVIPDCGLPRSVAWTVKRCLEKESIQRFCNVLELTRALNGCEMAIRHPHLHGLKIGMVEGRAVLPVALAPADGGLSGVLPDPALTASWGAAPDTIRGVLLGVIGAGIFAILLFLASGWFQARNRSLDPIEATHQR